MNYTLQSQNKSYSDLLGFAIAKRLNDAAEDLPHDISERLKSARVLALGKRKVVTLQRAHGVVSNGNAASLHLGEDDNGLWTRLAALLPLIALVAGLLTISFVQDQSRAKEIAEVDAELLTDDLPPAAYTDPGFAQFLTARRQD